MESTKHCLIASQSDSQFFCSALGFVHHMELWYIQLQCVTQIFSLLKPAQTYEIMYMKEKCAIEVQPVSPPLCLRRSHTDLTGYSLRSCARNRVAINCLHCNLCSVTPAPSCSLHSPSATLCQHEPGLKTSISKIFDIEVQNFDILI